jgi:hypothetical protein
MSIMDKLKKNSKIKTTDILSESKFFNEKTMTPTDVPMVNVALSGSIDGGLAPGLLVLAGPSKHFKTSFALLMAGAYLRQYPDAVMLFYDSEFGSPQSYFTQFGIDTSRVLHTPIANVEELKFALNEKSVADMSRAKALKGLFRMTTPYLSMKNIPLIAVNHTYMEIGLFPKAIVGGGTGIYYSADNIWILGRQQDKVGTEIKGYHFVINVEKSRFVKEKSKIPISVSWEGGVQRWSGLLEVALAGKYVAKPTIGWYQSVDQETGELVGPKYREKDTLTEEFWKPILENTDFKDFVQKQYSIGHASLIDMDSIVEEAND